MKNKKIFIFLFILIINLIPHIYVSLSKPGTLLNWYLTDDAFYYFKTAQNIAQGAGITFDGIAPTNGFHPLWMLICVPIFSLAKLNLFLPLRILIILQGILNAISGYLLYRILADNLNEEIGLIAAAFWMFFPSIHGITTKLGLESGINTLSILFLIFSLSRLPKIIDDQSLEIKNYLVISLAAILCLLSRLDNIFIILTIGIWLVFRTSSLRWSLLLDFSFIVSASAISYFLRIQATNNIFNFLPFFYLLIAFSLIIKPIILYFFSLYNVSNFKDLKQVIFKTFTAISISSLLIGAIFYFLFDLIHAFRGYSRSVLVYDWLLSLFLIVPLRIFQYIRFQSYECKDEDLTLKNNWHAWTLRGLNYFIPVFIVLAGYMAFNKFYAGNGMPVSGLIKRWWGTLPNTVYGRPITTLPGLIKGIFDSNYETGPLWLATKPVDSVALWLARAFQMTSSHDSVAAPFILVIVWIIIISLLVAAIYSSKHVFFQVADDLELPALAAGFFFHIISYKTTGYLNVRSWYWVGEMILLVLVFGLILGSVIKSKYLSKTTLKLKIGISSLVGIFLIAGFFFSILRDFPLNGSSIGQYDYLSEKDFIESQTKPGDVIGMTGGGLVSYFVPNRTIVNLDGLINSFEYFEDLKTNRANDYLKKIKVKYIYGEAPVLLESDPYRWVFTGHLHFVAQGPYFSLYDYCIDICK